MATNLAKVTSAPTVGVLLTGPVELAHRVRVTLAGGQGVLPRGAVLYQDSSTEGAGKCSLAAAANLVPGAVTTTGTETLVYTFTGPAQLFILEDAVDTGGSSAAVVTTGSAFDAGHFNAAALKFATGVTLTPAYAGLLRGQGIYLDYAQA